MTFTNANVSTVVAREGTFLVMAGVLMGVPGIYFAGRVIRGVLLGVTPLDPLTLTSVGPRPRDHARLLRSRSARAGIDPARLLRQE